MKYHVGVTTTSTQYKTLSQGSSMLDNTQAFVSDNKLSATIGIELMSSVVGVMGAN